MLIKNFIYKNRLLVIIFLSVFTVIGLTFLSSFPKEVKSITITEKNGIYDLVDIDNFEEKTIKLSPSNFYYPNIYLMPDVANAVSSTSVKNFNKIRADYLSQRFIIKVPDNNHSYDMNFNLSGRHAMEVYVNGKLVGKTGKLAKNKEDTEIWENNINFYSAPIDGKMDIILHSAQFYHAKRGASLAELNLSKSKIVSRPLTFKKIKGMAVMGGLLFATAILFSLYIMIYRTKTTLYFALACFSMALREFLQSQLWTYFSISGKVSFLLEYLSLVMVTIFLSLYLGYYLNGKFLKGAQYLAVIGSFIYGLFVLFCDSLFYTSILKYYQLLLVIAIVPGVLGLFFQIKKPNKEQCVSLYGIAVFFLAAVFDIVMYSDILGEGHNIPISESAMLVFVLSQTIFLFLINYRLLIQAKELEKKMALETEFLGNISHELKTPLTVMSGYAQTTNQIAQKMNTLESEEISRRMKLISSEAERLSLMVSQILDVSRIEEGRMVMEAVNCYIDEIIHLAIETHYPILNKNKNRLDIHIENGLNAIYADPIRISQVIINLVSNAVRFTRNGTISISVGKKDNELLISVSDTGCGISSAFLPHIFERYSKKYNSNTAATGTGLGLYICKYIIEQHGGEIYIKSKEGKGTTVFFTLPTI